MKRSSVFDKIDNPEPAPTRREVLKHISVGVLVLALFSCGLWAYEIDQANKAEIERLKREGEQKAVAAMMVNWPQKTGKTKMVKIARGTTGQADFIGEECNPAAGGSVLGYQQEETWHISRNEGDSVSTYDASNEITSNTGSPGEGYYGFPGWGVTREGVVTVPTGVSSGIYRIMYIYGFCELGPEHAPDLYSRIEKIYEFEVVCFTVTVTATPVS